MRGGDSGPALAPGEAGASLLVTRVTAREMPPKAPLDAEEVAALRRWVDAGAEWEGVVEPEDSAAPPGWAWRPLARPSVPAAKGTGHENPIDAFVADRLKRAAIPPGPPAGSRELARRVFFDLIGLPPSPEELGEFLADEAPGAWERLVDRLLASPHYGERWARHWLDAARFGESDGFEYDRLRAWAWPYRDYVIRSLNADRPYAEFIRDQIAGDVRVGATAETVAATGFLVAGPWDEANNIQANPVMRARTLEEEREDIVAAVSQTFLGLTVNCARCHDHKFDPIPARDYYRFASAFAGVRHGERPAATDEEVARREARMAELRAEVSRADDEARRVEGTVKERLRRRGIARGSAPSPRFRLSFESGPDSEDGALRGKLQGAAKVEGGRLVLDGNGAFLAIGSVPIPLTAKTLEAWLHLEDAAQRGGAVLSVQERGGGRFDAIVYGEREPRKWFAGSEGFARTKDLGAPEEPSEPRPLVHLAIAYDADGTIRTYRDGTLYGAPYRPAKAATRFSPVDTEILLGLRHTGAGNGFLKGEVEEARIYDRALSSEEVADSFSAGPEGPNEEIVRGEMTPEEASSRADAVARRDAAYTAIRALPAVPNVYAAKVDAPGVSHLLARGDVEKPGEAVSAMGLSLVKSPDPDFRLRPEAPEAERRRRLADWIASRENPLTWRVMANRVWHYHFGIGLVATPNDFGASGEPPSHPELLDWLACELRGSGGSLKALHRRIVTSETYKRSSRYSAEAAKKDSESRLLWRFPPRRLEGEAVRDAMLAVSGHLNRAMYGPSFRPFTFRVFNSNLYTLTDPIGPEFDRRTIYRMHVLSAKSPMLESLDCPDPSMKTPRRGRTTTPLQALALMNDPFVIRQAKGLAERAGREAGEDLGDRVERIYVIALARRPTTAEKGRAVELARSHGLHEIAWAVLNSSEFLHVD